MITLADGESITLSGVAAASLTASNFVFDQTPVTNNAGTMTIGDGAMLPLSGIVNNTGTIALELGWKRDDTRTHPAWHHASGRRPGHTVR